MKHFNAIVLLIATCSFAQSGSEIDKNGEVSQIRKGFYFSAGLTFGYSYYRDHYALGYDEKWEDFENYTYDAFELYGEARFGHYFSGVFSVYGLLGIGVGPASLEIEKDYHRHSKEERKYEASFIRLATGAGVEYYPVKDPESLGYGLFVGVAFGIALESVHYDPKQGKRTFLAYGGDLDNETMPSVFARIEVGKDWKISDRWMLGVALNYTIGDFDLEGNNRDYKYDIRTHLVGLTLRFTR